LAKLFALLFEHDRELFYQVILSGTSGTPSEFEEEGFQEKTARLLGAGIPADETCGRLNAPLPVHLVLEALQRAKRERTVHEKAPAVTPLLYLGHALEPLMSLLRELSGDPEQREEAEAELTLIANAAVIFYGVDFSLGMERLYRFGLQALRDVQKLLKGVPEDIRQRAGEEDPTFQALCQAVLENFPVLPGVFSVKSAEGPGEALRGGKKAFSLSKELAAIEDLLRDRFHH
jgi:hypothetical protein